MRSKYRVAGRDLDFRCVGTRCVSGQVVELDPGNIVVGTHIAEGSLVPVVDEPQKPKKEPR
jgi:hypothetical protein